MWLKRSSRKKSVHRISAFGGSRTTSAVINIYEHDPMKILKQPNRINTLISNNYTPDHKSAYGRKPLHQILSPILVLAQCFGLIPVYGVTARTSSKLKFRLISVKVLNTLVVVIGDILLGLGLSQLFIDEGVNFYTSIAVIFYVSAVTSTLLFLNLAIGWSKLMKEWAAVEITMKYYPMVCNLQKRIYYLVAVILLAGTMEHSLSMISTCLDMDDCISEGDAFQKYFEIRCSVLFRRVPFTFPIAILAELLNIMATFTWNFVDIFIMVMSMAVTELFQRITNRIKLIPNLVAHESVWRNIREDYTRIQFICRTVNSAISPIILMAFGCNLCFICAQLLHSIKPVRHLAEGIYFFYSLFYLIVRTVVLTLVVARVHESSREPISYLFNVPANSYCNEVSRFVQQITAEIVAMTGMNFFTVRRGMVLSVAGTIITYELVLVQFYALNAEDVSNEEPANYTKGPCVNPNP